MQQVLADRVTWEPSGMGMCINIPAKRDWRVAFFLVWLVGWTVGGRQVIAATFTDNGPQSYSLFNLVWLVGWFAGEVFVAGAIIWALAGQTRLDLDPASMRLTWMLAGVKVRSREFENPETRNLRFTPQTNAGRRSQSSCIKFESADKTISFGAGISDAEGLAVIGKMVKVYAFPKERALEYLDVAG